MRKNLRFWCKVLAISAVLTLVLSGVALYAHSAEKGKSCLLYTSDAADE